MAMLPGFEGWKFIRYDHALESGQLAYSWEEPLGGSTFYVFYADNTTYPISFPIGVLNKAEHYKTIGNLTYMYMPSRNVYYFKGAYAETWGGNTAYYIAQATSLTPQR